MAAAVMTVTSSTAAATVLVPFVPVAVTASIALTIVVPVIARFSVVAASLAMISTTAPFVPVASVDVPTITTLVPAPVVLFVA